MLNWVPVNVCCKYILLLSREAFVNDGVVVNVVNTRNHITWRYIIEAMQLTTGLVHTFGFLASISIDVFFFFSCRSPLRARIYSCLEGG